MTACVVCWVDVAPEDELELVAVGAGDREPLVARPDSPVEPEERDEPVEPVEPLDDRVGDRPVLLPLPVPPRVRPPVVGVVVGDVGVVDVVVGVVDVVVALWVSASSETNSALAAVTSVLASLAPVPEPEAPEDPDEPSSAAVRSSSAASRLSCAWLTESCADVGSSVASSWPWWTCWPMLTNTSASVPLVLKFANTSVPGSTLPEPVTVDWTTPFWAVTSSREVRAELDGGPSSSTPATTIAIATSASATRYHGPRRRTVISRSSQALSFGC